MIRTETKQSTCAVMTIDFRIPAMTLAISLILSGCGGGGENTKETALAPSVAVVAPSLSTGNPYYPMTQGTEIIYQVSPVTTRWDAESQRLDILGRGAMVNTQSLQYSVNYCAKDFGSKPFFVTTYNTGILTAPAPVDFTQSLQDALFTSSTGIPYLGEGMNAGGVVDPGEAKLSMEPVVGEVISASSRVTAGCGNSVVTIPPYAWRYRTIEHLDVWRGYSDVWRTGLIEYNGNGYAPAVYNYYFARGKGMVGFVWGNPMNTATNTATGYEYYATPK